MPLHIEQVRPELTWRLRREALYPNLPLYEMELEEDTNGWHFAAFNNDALVGVVSLFQHCCNFQFRKLAVAVNYQHQGVGSALLQYITNFAINENGARLWCNACKNAVPFYTKANFTASGETFSKNGIDYLIMEKPL
ncbi:GNAT family N-acetyltransferase [Mucilaginibacter aquatilis]|uniref:GNAT family N-acetyltransferase n=1 Tax=Mucilaginibacter aquatilis TaxID=1517760 RepID=A0A6I4I772_9SPHI|nr:GNAT family N-acetyltransferase [Mucilaginibacter aquatilis]MVN89948.1 GNAT family N-acetyltransferase [Mucilaginibacter aquatilis]